MFLLKSKIRKIELAPILRTTFSHVMNDYIPAQQTRSILVNSYIADGNHE